MDRVGWDERPLPLVLPLASEAGFSSGRRPSIISWRAVSIGFSDFVTELDWLAWILAERGGWGLCSSTFLVFQGG
jgi:hypothetical protein